MTSVHLYLDDCADSNRLANTLRQAGFPTTTPREVGTSGSDDADHLEYAAANGYTLITKNPKHFVALHHQWQSNGRIHSGILLIYQDNDPTRDMSPGDIARAIRNLLRAGLPIANEVHTLNHWQ
jgi:predicted nuclease of predicted toxin-antitoxin system